MADDDVNGKGSRGSGGDGGASGLTAKQLKFAQAWVENGGNVTDAARTAGYANPNEHGDRLIKHGGIRAYIEEHNSDVAVRQLITHESLFARQLNRALVNPKDYYDQNGDVKPMHELTDAQAKRIRGRRETQHGTELTFYDGAAIDNMLAQWTKLAEAGSTNLGPEEAATMIAAALVAAEELNSGDSPD